MSTLRHFVADSETRVHIINITLCLALTVKYVLELLLKFLNSVFSEVAYNL